jgi:hypothetical protein
MSYQPQRFRLLRSVRAYVRFGVLLKYALFPPRDDRGMITRRRLTKERLPVPTRVIVYTGSRTFPSGRGEVRFFPACPETVFSVQTPITHDSVEWTATR